MNSTSDRTTTALAGYAVGMGLAGIAIIGVPLQFAFPDVAGLLTYGGSFLIGAAIGAAVAAIRGA